MEYLELGPTPAEEECAQTLDPDFATKSKSECQIYKAYLERLFPIPQELEGKVEFKITSSSHDFGTYYEVAVGFNPSVEGAARFAYHVEANCPTRWDKDALRALAQKGLLKV